MNKKILIVTIATLLLLVGCGKVMPNNNAKQNRQSPCLPELDSEINDANKNESINMVLKYIESKNIKFNKRV